jgi:hypothetical protein
MDPISSRLTGVVSIILPSGERDHVPKKLLQAIPEQPERFD